VTSKGSADADPDLRRGGDAESPSTLRSIEVVESTPPDEQSPRHPVYCEPQPLVAVSDHKTIEVETVKLADDIDPRKLPTELRLARPNAVPPDSGGPQTDVVVVSSQPPLAPGRNWRAPAVLLLLLGALVLLVLARAAAQRSRGAAQAASAVTPLQASTPRPSAIVVEPPSPTWAVAAPSAAPPSAAPERETRVNPAQGNKNSKSPLRNIEPGPGASSRTLALPSASKPKRAIY
jgi:hypothetical protein